MKKYLLLSLILILGYASKAQTPNNYQPFSFDFYQKLNRQVYDVNSRFHSSFKSYYQDDSLLKSAVDSFYNYGTDTLKRSWVHRKLFNEHLLEIKKEDYTFYADFLPDFQIGYDRARSSNIWTNTRGYQFGGTIGSKFSFYTSGYENQAKFPQYIQNFVNANGIIPSQVNDKFGPGRDIKDWAYATAILSYTPIKYVNITLGQDKNFIGDGYRSVLLSDVAANYPFFKLTGTLGNVKYMSMWAQFQDLKSPQFSYDNGYRKKWGVFHYLDWNVTNRLSLGFFDSVIWQDADSTGKRGFDLSYVNPLIFLRPVEGQNGSPDNALIGFSVKYELFKNLAVYGQVAIDEFTIKEVFAGNGYWANKFAYQIGIKGFDAFKIKSLNYLLEYNTARPYTYSQRNSLLNYGHYNQPLAHLYGANFKEFVTICNYAYKRIDLMGKLNLAKYGLDGTNDNYGKDIFKSYNTRNSNYGNYTAQGIGTTLTFLEGKIGYLINPNYNLRLEIGGVIRSEKNTVFNNNTGIISLGIRSTFRNLYTDF
ncbi:gliding motility protein RemB [Pedobacter psychrophilus]|uniref:Gliding motility protein RemB n=1 Tax=Pedobacter psychrophilus TaxID=1826909 RepID=A0A179DDA6_9SPHI|nr:gliding motility protein RemB [Pedobacter psychrophilus]OAQ38782.1 gliding motility protein RemB [Pedobacter psychrophilus]